MLHIGAWEHTVQYSQNQVRPTALGSIWEQVFRGDSHFINEQSQKHKKIHYRVRSILAEHLGEGR